MNLVAKYRPRWTALVFLAIACAIAVYVTNSLFHFDAFSDVNWSRLAYALIWTIIAHLLSLALWVRIAAAFNIRTTFLHSGKAWFLSRLGRYIPGKISILLLRFHSYSGRSKTTVAAATIIEAYTSLIATALLLLLLTFTLTSPSSLSTIPFLVLFALLLLLFQHPMIELVVRLLGRFYRMPPLPCVPHPIALLSFSVTHLVVMLAHGAALFLTLNAFGQIDLANYLLVTSAFFVAGLIGMIAVFTPNGLGVREATLVALLSPHVPIHTLLAGAVAIRLIGVVSELTLTGLFFAAARSKRRKT